MHVCKMESLRYNSLSFVVQNLHYVFRMEHEAAQLEKQHVHSVYENTAAYFNDLQSKAWPRVRNFLLEQKPGSLVADIGKPVPEVA